MEPVIKGHPLHATIVPVAIGLLPASYALDILAMLTNSDELADAAYYNMLLGSVGAAPAALTGFWDFTSMAENDPAHKTAVTHGLMNGGIIALYGLNLWLRRNNKRSKLGFLLSTIGTAGLIASGYLGGEIAYGRGWRVRSAERFELEWQKQHKVGPFAEKGQSPGSLEQEYPPEVIKGFQEKKSGEAVFKEIQEQPESENETNSPQVRLLQQSPSTKPVNKSKSGPVSDSNQRNAAVTGNTADDKPSQAEGDRDTIDADLGEPAQPAAEKRSRGRKANNFSPDDRPSQAEGDRDTIDADLDDNNHSPTAQG